MDLVPVKPQPPARAAPAQTRATSRTAAAKAAHPAAAHAGAPVTADDVDLLAQQAAFDRMTMIRAELQREANALRDLAMEQIKRDDAVMGQWIKLI